MRSRLRSSVLSLAIAVGLMFIAPTVGAAFKYLHEGMTAPKVVGVDLLTKEKVNLKELLDEHLVMVVFWASWSERSVEQLADLKGIITERESQPIKVIAINVEGETVTPETRKRIVSLVRELDLPFPVIIDEKLEIFYSFGVIAVPSSAILDREGVLRYGPAGYSLTTRDRIIDSIDVLLGLRAPEATEELMVGYQPTNTASRYYRLALGMLRQGMYDRALDHLESAIEADSGFSAPYTVRGEIDLKLEKNDSALLAYHQALELDSNSIVAVTGLGESYLANGQADSARIMFLRALEIEETYTPAILGLSLCLTQLEQAPEALKMLKQARDLNPTDVRTLYYLGRVSRDAGEIDSALVAYQTALQILFDGE